jgi:hypothetical protein
MKKALVFSDTISGEGLVRKTVVVIDRSNPSAETFAAFVIICDGEGLLHEPAYEIPLVAEVPDSAFVLGYIVPVEAPNDHTVLLNTQEPDKSESIPN